MKIISLIHLALVFLLVSCAHQPKPPSGPASDPRLDLSFEEFDLSPDKGWVPLVAQGRYLEINQLIQLYINRHPKLSPDQLASLRFHAGQALAVSGNIQPAVEQFQKAYVFTPSELVPPTWNDYISATIFFLQGDRDQLARARNRIAASPGKEFLEDVDMFLREFGKASYKELVFPDNN